MVAFTSLQHHPADQTLERRVSAALDHCDPVGFHHVDVSARSNVVVLRGTVATYHAKAAALKCVRDLAGVAAAIDGLEVHTLRSRNRVFGMADHLVPSASL